MAAVLIVFVLANLRGNEDEIPAVDCGSRGRALLWQDY
jgi:hypothetical protein